MLDPYNGGARLTINLANAIAAQSDIERNVFLMIRFREAPEYEAIAAALSDVLAQYSLNLIRADWKQHNDELWSNVRYCMDNAAYGIAVFEYIGEQTLSPNVSLELGYMLAKGKRCLLLKEKGVPELQADLVGHLCREFDAERIAESVGTEVRSWLRDLGIAKRLDEKLVVFVSHGGTCRDPMAKVIAQKLLQANPPSYPIRFEAAALIQPSGPTASFAAREVIKEMFDKDLLATYRSSALSPALIEDADLILVMDTSLIIRKLLPSEKTFVLKPYFGLTGDIVDPYPDGRDEATLARYRTCARELREIIEANLASLISNLRPEVIP